MSEPFEMPLTLEEFQSEPPPPPMLTDYAAKMVVDPPAVPPADGDTNRTTIVPLDADEGPADLETEIQSRLNHETERALAQLEGSDRELYPVRSRVRPSIEPILARHAARLADIRNRAAPPGPTAADGEVAVRLQGAEGLAPNHPSRLKLEALERRIRARGSLTDTGARLEIQAADAERDAALNDLARQWRDQLNDVAAQATKVLEAGTVTVTETDRRAGLLLVQELGATSPRHGLPLLKWAIRDAAVDPDARASLLMALPGLRSMYENEHSPYGGSVQLRALIGQANDLFHDADQQVARVRLQRIEKTKWEIDEFIRNALGGGSEALDRDGRPVLLPPEPPPRPLPEPRAAPKPFRRASSASAGQREADLEARRAARRAEDEE